MYLLKGEKSMDYGKMEEESVGSLKKKLLILNEGIQVTYLFLMILKVQIFERRVSILKCHMILKKIGILF